MPEFLIDANLPKRFRFWHNDTCEFVPDPEWPDHVIWRYPKERGLTVVTKDGDFERLALTEGPPIVIKLCAGHMAKKQLWQLLERW